MNGNLIAGTMGFVGIVLMCFAGFVIVDYDLSKVVFVVAIVLIAMAVIVEIIERGFWK